MFMTKMSTPSIRNLPSFQGKADRSCASSPKGLEGTAEPATKGDDLDVTRKSAHSKSPDIIGADNEGLSMTAKLFCASVIIALCVGFVRTRKNYRTLYRNLA